MNCPVCNIRFWATQRQHVQIHYCPRCLGIWIEGGGLEKIVKGSSAKAHESGRFGTNARGTRTIWDTSDYPGES